MRNTLVGLIIALSGCSDYSLDRIGVHYNVPIASDYVQDDISEPQIPWDECPEGEEWHKATINPIISSRDGTLYEEFSSEEREGYTINNVGWSTSGDEHFYAEFDISNIAYVVANNKIMVTSASLLLYATASVCNTSWDASICACDEESGLDPLDVRVYLSDQIEGSITYDNMPIYNETAASDSIEINPPAGTSQQTPYVLDEMVLDNEQMTGMVTSGEEMLSLLVIADRHGQQKDTAVAGVELADAEYAPTLMLDYSVCGASDELSLVNNPFLF
ncbi:hypothetical protein COV16_04175 [Candidatus Woesearchaeota archaeon CG10_big_fil_rev_8_21_14_0_10_34_8]|nr:MAG: hypothetical protein COV16_04175 [Candidatus Woesearchaeota archaeon CG10_big_fil_rev_8_21_14_0_10_34_8]